VVFAGGDPCCQYGYYVDIQHADGYLTRYGHLSRILVSLGQTVGQGDVIGASGSTGYSTGPHVHFELRRNGNVLNPLNFLP
jgi:murein DD-endopeptidase MepM/ murein hydrolase activator NlpD